MFYINWVFDIGLVILFLKKDVDCFVVFLGYRNKFEFLWGIELYIFVLVYYYGVIENFGVSDVFFCL